MTQAELKSAIEAWRDKELRKSKKKATVYDRAECLQIFADQGPNLGAAVAYAEHLFKQTGSIQLLSGHKAKGLEWNTVYHLDPWRIERNLDQLSAEEADQELNVKYVILTRAKRNYHEVNSDDIIS